MHKLKHKQLLHLTNAKHHDGKGLYISILSQGRGKTIVSLPENVNYGIKASTVKQFLNSSGLPSKWAERDKPMSNKEISKIASKQTVMVVCHN